MQSLLHYFKFMRKYNRVFAEINLNHIEYNVDSMCGLLQPDCKLMVVIKANGYGHGAVQVARLFEGDNRIFGYAVATVEEAIELRKQGILKPILILGYTFPEDYELIVSYDLIPTVFREDALEALSQAAGKAGKTLRVHVKVDTGMSRIGITPDDRGLTFIGKVLAQECLELHGIFTHFARADEADLSAALLQFERFQSFVSKAEAHFDIQIPCKHCANSAGILALPQSYLNMVRAGIATYGLWPSDEMRRDRIELRPALSLYSRIVYIKEISAGTPVSYGGTFVAERTMRIATVPVGYGDGYPRSLSGRGYVLISGQKAPILGRVCMDQLMVDVTSIPEAREQDRVTLIGKDGMEEITMEALGDISGRFHYELACDLGRRIPRVYLYDGETVDTETF